MESTAKGGLVFFTIAVQWNGSCEQSLGILIRQWSRLICDDVYPVNSYPIFDPALPLGNRGQAHLPSIGLVWVHTVGSHVLTVFLAIH